MRLMADVLDSALDTQTKVSVMQALANSADDDGANCFPGVRLIARRARVSERTVIRTIQDLEAMGYLKMARRGGGSGWFSEYFLNAYRLHEEAEKTRLEDRERKMRKGCHGVTLSRRRNVTRATGKCDTGDRICDIGDTPLYVLPGLYPASDPLPLPLASEGRREIEVGHATDQVMSALGVANRRKRGLVQRAIVMAAEKGELPATIALDVIRAVRDQDEEHLAGRLKFKFGLQKFVGEGIWRDRNRWAWDPETMRLQAEARAGSR